ncbi:uncharacterized protein PGTG_15595 [Puccinia graminis f. sp. tritici CRL 75-36-700-3]|uniref:Peptidase S54 rhomboid domain-containing protein n=1 Tax=Puccinia graminis f. sp. tritici (strain CRL 75-36-700-3 / race SCCL) TaxID=418459 RepID=E3KZA7_PUCGT|nr:uncharacterized protein PGTG_15595 [Puccinia graminis f. sp. tritici CRL 75-36-700-3]EFP89632.2 hypothetical protein PGTG_15595 [Puccinia graminis f. sp. tritici CRL 75-36-700-3]
MRQSCFHSSYRWLGHLSPTKTIASSQSRMRMLKQADHVVFQIRPSNFENLRDSTRKFSSTSRMLAQLGRINVKKMPITDHDSNFALNEDILQETRNTDSASNRKPTVWKPFAFFLGVSMLGFGLAVDQTNRDTAQKIDYIRTHQGTFPGWFSKTFTGIASYLDPSDAQLQQLRKLDKLNFIKEYGLNNLFPHHLLTWYINLGEGKQICCILALINLQIFALWQMPRFFKYMTQRFTHFPLSGKSYTLITSTFSHSSALHFGFNMLALYSIGSTAHDFLTHRLRASRDVDPVRIPESTPTYHFLAFYVFAGLAASFGSHAYSLLIRAPRLLKWRQGLSKSSTPPSPILPSLGASGAIYGCLTMTALAFPEAHVSLIFLPWVPLKIGNAVFGAMLFDFIGVIRNWRYFDHMAHLCGGLAGVFWYFFVDKWFDVIRLRVWDRYLVKENNK